MSADNGIYILQSLDGYRITHAQAIENIYWWEKWSCCDNPVPCKKDGEDVCQHCGNPLPTYEKRDEINPQALREYFGKCTVYDTEKEVLEEATNIFDEIMNDDMGILEYGISFIRGWENKFFPCLKGK